MFRVQGSGWETNGSMRRGGGMCSIENLSSHESQEMKEVGKGEVGCYKTLFGFILPFRFVS